MKYLVWAFYAILDILFNIVCYFTNPIVVLFADEYGNLPKCLRYWQTYDNTLDVEWMVTENVVPKIFQYDFNKHYKYHYEDKSVYPCIAGKVDLLDPNFTLKERIQRYFCRLLWLYRNTGYGFSYEVSGKEYNPQDIVVIEEYNYGKDNEKHVYDLNNSYLWRFYYTKCWFWKFYIRIYLGWKLCKSDLTKDKAMIAMFVHPFRMVD